MSDLEVNNSYDEIWGYKNTKRKKHKYKKLSTRSSLVAKAAVVACISVPVIGVASSEIYTQTTSTERPPIIQEVFDAIEDKKVEPLLENQVVGYEKGVVTIDFDVVVNDAKKIDEARVVLFDKEYLVSLDENKHGHLEVEGNGVDGEYEAQILVDYRLKEDKQLTSSHLFTLYVPKPPVVDDFKVSLQKNTLALNCVIEEKDAKILAVKALVADESYDLYKIEDGAYACVNETILTNGEYEVLLQVDYELEEEVNNIQLTKQLVVEHLPPKIESAVVTPNRESTTETYVAKGKIAINDGIITKVVVSFMCGIDGDYDYRIVTKNITISLNEDGSFKQQIKLKEGEWEAHQFSITVYYEYEGKSGKLTKKNIERYE